MRAQAKTQYRAPPYRFTLEGWSGHFKRHGDTAITTATAKTGQARHPSTLLIGQRRNRLLNQFERAL